MKCDCYFPEERFKSKQAIKPHYKMYACWAAMLSRCYNCENKNFKYYGGRGLKVSKEWMDDFGKYLSDIGETPEGMSLDRTDNDGHYCRHNFKWSTRLEQNMNRRIFIKKSDLPVGIYRVKTGGYMSRLTINGKTHHVGFSRNLEELVEKHRAYYFEIYGKNP